MDFTYIQSLVDMGISLAELAIKGTATAIANKIRAVKMKTMQLLGFNYKATISESLMQIRKIANFHNISVFVTVIS